ncbi:MAG TPA: alpha-L-fucosidase [Candidatus Acidoferrales bacterium]|nr:alpha-L-fucosidase [Candidatus Acidoferrales bacterium]
MRLALLPADFPLGQQPRLEQHNAPMPHTISRRDTLKLFGASAAAAGAGIAAPKLAWAARENQSSTPGRAWAAPHSQPAASAAPSLGQSAAQNDEQQREDLSRAARMAWWHAAKFGMFIHFGLYSVYGHHEWAMEEEGIPVAEYEQLAHRFNPRPGFAREWARLAKRAGQKYMVMTSKHHEGFCNFATKLTNYCAPDQGPGRDLAKEYVEAARAEGLRVGFYYSLMDWHHPDGTRCATDPAARERFVAYTHGLIREIMTNYGKLDVLWYDVAWPLDAAAWQSEKMNQMVFGLQPEIIVNNRNLLPGDFSTPEQEISASEEGRAWESCMTMNDSWGYQRADDDWKSPKTIVRNLVECAQGGGNYLLNIGPTGDGSVPSESIATLEAVGRWMGDNGPTIYESERSKVTTSEMAGFTRKGNTLYVHVHFWPGSTVAIGGLRSKVTSARMYVTKQPVEFKQEEFRVQFTGLPNHPPDPLATVIEVECESEPVQDTRWVRENRPRRGVGVGV